MAMIKPIPVTSLPRARPRPDNDWRNAQVCPSSILRVAAHFPLCGPDLACDGELDVASTPWKFLSRWREGLSRRDLPCGTKLCRRCVSRVTIIKVESPETKRRHESQSARPTVSMLTSKATARVTEQRLYQLIRQPQPIADRQIEIEFLDPGAEAHAFTFG
jgi:hypothetical protein